MTDILSRIMDAIQVKQAPPDELILLLSFVLATAATFPPTWHYSRNIITIVHEGGHALMGAFWGRRITGIKLHSDTSGVTVSSGKSWGLGMIFTVLAGYTSPALLGALLALLLAKGYTTPTLLGLSLCFAIMFLFIRNLWGFLLVGPGAVACYFVSMNTAPEIQVFALSFLMWFLTVGSLRPIVELQLKRMKGEAPDSDADQLQRLTFVIPGTMWVFIFIIIEFIGISLTLDRLVF